MGKSNVPSPWGGKEDCKFKISSIAFFKGEVEKCISASANLTNLHLFGGFTSLLYF